MTDIFGRMTQNSSPFVLIHITCGDMDNARQIAKALVEERLAACVSILPGVESVYRWQDALENSLEIQLLVKSRRELMDKIRERVCNLHHYELPEIIAVPIVEGLQTYLNWITESVTQHA